jgi:hypothetical protein
MFSCFHFGLQIATTTNRQPFQNGGKGRPIQTFGAAPFVKVKIRDNAEVFGIGDPLEYQYTVLLLYYRST